MGETESAEVNLRTYVQILRRRFLWILAVTAAALALAGAFIGLQDKRYSATAQLLVQPASGSVPIAGTQQTISPTDVLTELQLLTGAPVQARAAKTLGYEPKISASEVGQTNVIELTGTGPTPISAATVANTYARAFVAYQRANAINALTTAEQQYESQIKAIDGQIQSIEQAPTSASASTISALTSQVTVLKEELAELQVTGAETPGGIEVVSLASAPRSPSSPRPLEDVAIALVLGLILGVSAALMAEYFDDKVYTRNQAEVLSGGLPVLAMIPKVSKWAKSGKSTLIAAEDPLSLLAESYRSLRTSLLFAGHDRHMKTILVTSPTGSEGKTSTVANLGVVLADAGERVVIVGCDLRRPRISQIFHQTESPGFTSVLLGHDELANVLRPVDGVPLLRLLSAGPIPPNPADLLGSDKARAIFRALAMEFDIVLIDGTPVLPVTDALVLSRNADAVIVVVAAGHTTSGQIERASELLRQAGAQTVGLVLNKAVRRWGNGAEYGYKYGYKYRYKNRFTASESTLSPNGGASYPVESDVTAEKTT